MKLDVYKYIMPTKATSMAYIKIPLFSNTNTITSLTVEILPLILLECLDQSSWDLVCVSWHVRPSQQFTS
jgi:hypothetical protein